MKAIADKRISEIIADKRTSEIYVDVDGVEIDLLTGYQIDGVHSIIEDTLDEATSRLADVTECDCEACIS